MSYQVLARKYRPQKFSDVIGQDHVTGTLQNAISQQRIAHGYIFSGHRGIGKTTIARILAMALNCRKSDRPTPEPCGVCESCTEVRAGNAVDVIEIDAATNRGIDEIRELREAARYRPARDRYKIYILDEAHQITDAAFNALLKTLEEPPAHMVFMMATTQPEDIPQTIRSRCQHFSFHAVRFDDIVGQLQSIAKQETISVESDALAVLAEAGDGSMRDALSIMDQAIACGGASSAITADQVRSLVGSVSSEVLERMMDSIARNSTQEVLQQVDKLVTEGQSPTHFIRQLVRFLRNSVVAKVDGTESVLLQISSDERLRMARVAKQFAEEDLTRFLNIALRTYDDLGYKQEQRFHLELGLMKMVHAQRLLSMEQILSQQPVLIRTQSPGTARTASSPTAVPPSSARPERASEVAATSSPFEADRTRKGRSPEMASGSGRSPEHQSRPSTTASAVALATAIAIAGARQESATVAVPVGTAPPVDLAQLRAGVLCALGDASQGMLANLLDDGEWSVEANELIIKVAKSPVLIDMSFGAEPKKLASAAASQTAGRPMKVKVISGNVNGSAATAVPTSTHRGTARPAGSARNRAAEDPIVGYMQQKFKAEIRTVVDHRAKENPDFNQ